MNALNWLKHVQNYHLGLRLLLHVTALPEDSAIMIQCAQIYAVSHGRMVLQLAQLRWQNTLVCVAGVTQGSTLTLLKKHVLAVHKEAIQIPQTHNCSATHAQMAQQIQRQTIQAAVHLALQEHMERRDNVTVVQSALIAIQQALRPVHLVQTDTQHHRPAAPVVVHAQ